jgi:hypothetical protein
MDSGEIGSGEKLGTFVRFLLPAIVALGIGLLLYLSGAYKTREDFVEQVEKYAKANSAERAEISSRRPMIEKVAIELDATARGAIVTRQDLRSRLDGLMAFHIAETLIMMSLMVLLPFGIIGSGLVRHGGRDNRLYATKGFGMKLMLALLLAFGWQYILNPLGITGTTLSTWWRGWSLVDAASRHHTEPENAIRGGRDRRYLRAGRWQIRADHTRDCGQPQTASILAGYLTPRDSDRNRKMEGGLRSRHDRERIPV